MSAEQTELKRHVHQLAWDNLQASAFPNLTAAKVLADPRRIHRELFGERFESWREEHGQGEGNKVGIRLSWQDSNQVRRIVEIISEPNGGFMVRGGILGSTQIMPRSTAEYQRQALEKACTHPIRVLLSPPSPQ
ncbi:hypothetical protein HYS96_04305 [Candidatus Daviesbacteria bacterium]|nr:hypothetical protein [Candidatus Daviesbacteria bacterium]